MRVTDLRFTSEDGRELVELVLRGYDLRREEEGRLELLNG